MGYLSSMKIVVGGRGSPLSKVQVEEVEAEIKKFNPQVVFAPLWITTYGDKDRTTSLKSLDKTDFFTREIDEALKKGECRIGIHSAKDLPDPLPKGLVVVAFTKGLDSSDSLVVREGKTLKKVATSSARREKTVKELWPDVECVDIRGNIDERLRQLDEGIVDGVIVAECALIRLKLTHRTRIPLPGETAPGQGQLAVVARVGDAEMAELFSAIDSR